MQQDGLGAWKVLTGLLGFPRCLARQEKSILEQHTGMSFENLAWIAIDCTIADRNAINLAGKDPICLVWPERQQWWRKLCSRTESVSNRI